MNYAPDLFLYLIVSVFATVLERVLTLIPSFVIMAKVIPAGVEGTMVSLFTTIINLNQFTIKSVSGTFINDRFVGLDTSNIDKYWILAIIETVFKVFPIFYIYLLVPKNDEVSDLQNKYIE